MKNKTLKIIVAVTLALLVFTLALWCVARFVYLAPGCFADSKELTERENYFIKKAVLEAVEDRLSVASEGKGTLKLDEGEEPPKHLFVFINSDFMDSVTRDMHTGEYIVEVKAYFMEPGYEVCYYEIQLSSSFSVTFFGLDI